MSDRIVSLRPSDKTVGMRRDHTLLTRTHVGLLAVLFTLLWWILLNGRPLLDPDEGRYAEIPREMLATGDWVIPHLNGLAYLEKPPLQYWATALAYRAFGVHEWSARLFTGLTSLLTVFLVYGFARRTWGQREALWAAGILASSTLFILVGHLLTLDTSLTFFLTLALLAFCDAQGHRDRPHIARLGMLVCWAAMGAAFLTKGIVGLLIPGAVLVLYSLWQRDWACWKHLYAGLGIPLFLLIVTPWVVLAARTNPQFLEFFFLHEHFARFLTRVHARYQPWWFFLMVLAIGVLPWLPQTVRALLSGARRTVPRGTFDTRRVLWVWSVFVLMFFSLSQSKLIPYILPVFPSLALLIARQGLAEHRRDAVIALALTSLAAAGLLVCAHPGIVFDRDPAHSALWLAFKPKLYCIVAVLAAGTVFGVWTLKMQQASRALAGLALAWFLGIGVLFKSLGPIIPLYSAKPLAFLTREGYDPNVPVYSVRQFRHTLPFYWGRELTLVDYRGELALGLDQAPHAGIASLEEFKQRWIAAPDALAVLPVPLYHDLRKAGLPMHLTAQTAETVVVDRR